MEKYRYINNPLHKLTFDKNRNRVKQCPCGKNNQDGKFVPYIGYNDKGYCYSCCKTFLPESPKFEQWEKSFPFPIPIKQKKQETLMPVSFIPKEIVEESLQHYSENNFVKFLCRLFSAEITNRVIEKYFIGTSKHWSGANVFWQIDTQGKVRTGKIMLYNPDTGRRIKEHFDHITFSHSVLKIEDFNLQQCFFGEHLLQANTNPIAIFESEKTAVIASVYFQQFICLACGGLGGLTAKKCKILKGQNIILFSDLNGLEKWRNKAKELSRLFPETRFNIFDLLERKATETEKQQGLDIADYLIPFNYREFTIQLPKPQSELLSVETLANFELFQTGQIRHPIKEQPESWDKNITELEYFFKTIALPSQPIKLNPCETIKNVLLFIESHFTIVKANNGKKTFLPYLRRLNELKEYLSTSLN